MTDDPLPGIHPGRVIHARGQRWITDENVELCGYAGVQGEIVRVERAAFAAGDDRLYELAALMSPVRAGVTSTTERVWWLLPVRAPATAPEPEAATPSTSERG